MRQRLLVVVVAGLFELIQRFDGALQADPLEGWLLAVDGVALLDEPKRGQNVGDVVQPTDLGLELLLLLDGIRIGSSIGDGIVVLVILPFIYPFSGFF